MHRKVLSAIMALMLALTIILPTALAEGADSAAQPTAAPTVIPTEEPGEPATDEPSAMPTYIPTAQPTPAPTPMVLTEDVQGDIVKEVQTRLRLLGFLTDDADGYFGPNTRKGVIAFQEFMAEHAGVQLQYVDPSATAQPTALPTKIPTMEPTALPTSTPKALHYFGTEQPGSTAAATPAPTALPTPTPTPYVADGILDEHGYEVLNDPDFKVYYSDLTNGVEGSDVSRLQRRLTNLYYLVDGVDGMFGSNTESAVRYFQKHNGLEQSGIADKATQEKLYAEDAVPTAKPTLEPANKHSKGNGKSYSKYKLVVDVSDQRVYAYGYENGAYGPLARVMVCSTGTKSNPTPLGTFRGDGPTNRWHYFTKYKCYAQYSWRIDGSILFHSVLYNQKGGEPTSSSVRNLGKRASHGCIRLSVKDAKWIYNNCADGTTVVVRN